MKLILNLIPLLIFFFILVLICINIFNIFPTIHCCYNTICWSYNKVKYENQIKKQGPVNIFCPCM